MDHLHASVAVIKLAEKAWAEGGEFSSAVNRVELNKGSFFHATDIGFMRFILHDWQIEEVLTILRNVRGAMGNSNSTLLIGECALPEHNTVGVPPAMYNIDVQRRIFFGASSPKADLSLFVSTQLDHFCLG